MDLDGETFRCSSDYDRVASDWRTRVSLESGILCLYNADGYSFEVTSFEKELGKWTGYLWRRIDTKEVLAASHGSRLAEMIVVLSRYFGDE